MQNDARILGAELIGAAVLMLAGPGAVILGGGDGPLGVALGFGLATIVLAYLIGPISGCQLSPAVSLGLLMARRINGRQATMAIVGQVIGAVIGGGILLAIASGRPGFQRGAFASNGWGRLSPDGYDLAAVIVAEFVLSAVLVMIFLMAAKRGISNGLGPIAVGLGYFVVALVLARVDLVGANPARTLGTAIYATWSSDALSESLLFIIVPVIGAVLGVLLWLMIDEARLESTGLFFPGVAQARDLGDHLIEDAVGAIDHEIDDAGGHPDEPGPVPRPGEDPR